MEGYKEHKFNGARALREALEWKGLQDEEKSAQKRHAQARVRNVGLPEFKAPSRQVSPCNDRVQIT